jgi:hypothetical protein
MKVPPVAIKVLIAIFLVIAILVHILGLFTHVSDESLASHLIHIASYSLCLFTFLKPIKFRLWLYCMGMVYPFMFHANCFFMPLIQQQKFNAICLQVIVILPLAAVLIWQWDKAANIE